MLILKDLPILNALLNSTSAILLLTGLWFIKRGNITAHRIAMSSALGTSTLFLISYLIYHAQVGSVPFQQQGWIRPLYFAVLISHTILATVIVPLVLRTFWLAITGRFNQHKRWARWTLPLWLYVSVTGVVVYWMLYKM